MKNKVSLGVSGSGGGCTGCIGPNIPWTPQQLEEGGGFWSPLPPDPPPPLRPFELFKGCRGQGLHLGAPHGGNFSGEICIYKHV